MNRRNVEAMSPAQDFAYIVGPGRTPLRIAATAEEEEQRPHTRSYALEDLVISPFLYGKLSLSMSPVVGVVLQKNDKSAEASPTGS